MARAYCIRIYVDCRRAVRSGTLTKPPRAAKVTRQMLLLSPRFFVSSVRDAHADEYGEPIPWTAAVLFVLFNWRWLCRQEAANWPPEA